MEHVRTLYIQSQSGVLHNSTQVQRKFNKVTRSSTTSTSISPRTTSTISLQEAYDTLKQQDHTRNEQELTLSSENKKSREKRALLAVEGRRDESHTRSVDLRPSSEHVRQVSTHRDGEATFKWRVLIVTGTWRRMIMGVLIGSKLLRRCFPPKKMDRELLDKTCGEKMQEKASGTINPGGISQS